MKSNKQKVIIFLYNRLFDPLIQSNFWLYIEDYLNDSNRKFDFYLITYEDPKFPLTPEQLALVSKWTMQGLKWKKLDWNPGIGLKAKIVDIIQGFFAVMTLRLKGHGYVVSLASVAGTFVYLYSLILRLKFFLYQFEPHSEYALDNGMWPEGGFQYKISHYLERKAAFSATVIASGTRFMEERLKHDWKVQATFVKIPTVANDKKFLFDPVLRAQKRKELGYTDEMQILFYPGKFGDLYYREETAWMFRWLKEELPMLHFLIVTPHTDQEVETLFEKANVPRDWYTIAHSGYETIHHFHCAADFAVIAVPPGPSKKFISNIKVGEYLCAGLPFLITKGVSEDYLYATEQNVGVVVQDFKKDDVKAVVLEVKDFLEDNRQELRKHCREVGLDYRGFDNLNKQFKRAMQALCA
ncbi:MAG: hypothetical protein JXQ90_21160 [Cyclobacteriaceae bacterium]